MVRSNSWHQCEGDYKEGRIGLVNVDITSHGKNHFSVMLGSNNTLDFHEGEY